MARTKTSEVLAAASAPRRGNVEVEPSPAVPPRTPKPRTGATASSKPSTAAKTAGGAPRPRRKTPATVLDGNASAEASKVLPDADGAWPQLDRRTPGQLSKLRASSSQEDDEFASDDFMDMRVDLAASDGEIPGLSPVAMRLLQAASDMRESPDSYERAFLARQLIQCTFPHKDPGDIPIWSRTNGNLTLSIRPLYDEDRGEHKYPYGTIPRLFLYWMVTEAARTKNRRLYLGQTYPEFMRKLGLNPTNGGVRSDSRRLRDQIERMLRATISFKQTIRRDGKSGDAWLDMQIGPEAVLWWNFDQEQESLFESYIELSEKFFSAITSSPIPLDMRALRALRKSPLSLDLYSLICHKTYSARKDGDTKTIPWDGLHRQMGAEYKELRNFKQKVQAAIRKIKLVYPEMKVNLSEAGMHVHPAPLAIPERPSSRELPPVVDVIRPERGEDARLRRR